MMKPTTNGQKEWYLNTAKMVRLLNGQTEPKRSWSLNDEEVFTLKPSLIFGFPVVFSVGMMKPKNGATA
jgi:hypothetical protein